MATQKTTQKTTKSRPLARPVWLDEIGAQLRRWSTLQVGRGRRGAPPPLPDLRTRLRQLEANGYGSLGRPFTAGLRRQGMSEEGARDALARAVRNRIIVARSGGGWTVAGAAS